MLCALVAAGCRVPERVGADSEPTVTASKAPVDRSRQFPAHIDVRVRGAARLDWSGEDVIDLIRVGRIDLDTNLVSIQTLFPVPLPEDPATRLRWGFDYFGDYEDVPGTFTIPVRDPSRPPKPGEPRGMALVVWMKVKDPAAEEVHEMSEVHFLREFRELREPCELELGTAAATGHLRCPQVAGPDGLIVSLEVTWREIDQAGAKGLG